MPMTGHFSVTIDRVRNGCESAAADKGSMIELSVRKTVSFWKG